MSDIKEVGQGESKKRRITKDDWQFIADFVMEEHDRRKQNRKDLERHWDDIDRQIRMAPDETHKMDAKRRKMDPNKAWMASVEPPFQAQTLEVLTADVRRMQSPDAGPWFAPHAALTDEYLRNVDFQSLITGDENDVPSVISQDNADKLVEGFCSHLMAQYDFWGNMDLINTEALKYGVGIGRARMVTKNVFINTSRGVVKDTVKLPVLFPRSIRQTYLDDSAHNLANEGLMVGPAQTSERPIRFVDLVESALKGSKDPNDPDGGWMVGGLKDVDGGDDGHIRLIEYEGDLIIPRKTTRSLFIPGAIVTVMVGKSGERVVRSVVRFRVRQFPFTSYVEFAYHREDQGDIYPTSPLLKGRPLQIAIADALNKLMDAGALKNQPPIGYDKDNPFYQTEGGPRLFPGAQNPTTDDIQVMDIGDPQTMLAVYVQMVNLYYDVTGVNQPRLGAQTKSHTTAFAKDAEINRGVVRTVDYVRSTNKGPMARWLDMMYTMGREFSGERTFYIDAYGGFVTIEQQHLPELVRFDVFGAGGPEEAAQKRDAKLIAAQQAIALDNMLVQTGQQPNLNVSAIQRQILLEGGWTDVDQVIESGSQDAGAPALGGPVVAGSGPGTGAAIEALRSIRQAG